MALKGKTLTVTFTVWDTDNQVPKTGDAANLTMRVIKDGVPAAATNTPSENENGEYSLELTADEMDANYVTVEGSSSTANVVVFPVHIVTEQNYLTKLFDRLGSFTGSGDNTVLGFLKALASKTANLPSDIGGTFDPSTDSLEAIEDGIADKSFLNFVQGSITSSSVTSSGVEQVYTTNNEIIRGSQWPPADETCSVVITKTNGWPSGADTWTWKMHLSRNLSGGTPDLTLTASDVSVSSNDLTAKFSATPTETDSLPATGWYRVDIESVDGSGVSSFWDAVQGRASVRDSAGES